MSRVVGLRIKTKAPQVQGPKEQTPAANGENKAPKAAGKNANKNKK